MTAIAVEKMESQDGSVGGRNSRTDRYIVTGTTVKSDAEQAVATAAPPSFTSVINGITFVLALDTVYSRPILNADPPTMWEAEAEYVAVQFSTQPYNEGDVALSFAIGTSTVKRTQALEEVGAYGGSYDLFGTWTPGTAPSMGGLIGVKSDGTIEGVDDDDPTYKFQETHYLPDSDVNLTFRQNLWAVIKSPINNAPFRLCDAGEAKFLGCNGCRRNRNADWEITFEFAGSPNSTDVFASPHPLSAKFPGVVKKGWEYLWFTYADVVQTVGTRKLVVPMPDGVYVDRIKNSSDFSLLGIGTT